MVARRKWMLRTTAHCSQRCLRRPHPVMPLLFAEGWGHFSF